MIPQINGASKAFTPGSKTAGKSLRLRSATPTIIAVTAASSGCFPPISTRTLAFIESHARTAIGEVAGERLLLAKPTTFVNLSGKAVGCLVRKHDVAPGDLLVICDDLDLPLGKIRLRASGGSGGHKGMKSIISALGREDFPRIRVGIGRPQGKEIPGSDEDIIVNYVLSDFSPQEEDAIKLAIIRVAEAIDCFLTQGIEAAMSKFN